MSLPDDALDAIVVGGGPAGLSAALWLGRYGRSALVVDEGRPRNAPTWAVHGYPGVADLPPHDLRERMIEQCMGTGVRFLSGRARVVEGGKDRFLVRLDEGEPLEGRRLVLAYGRKDVVPEIPGLDELYGTSLFHCADCDGPSMAGSRVGVIGADRNAASLALFLSYWAERIVLLANGGSGDLDEDAGRRLRQEGIEVVPEPISRLESERGRLTSVALEGGAALRLDGIFFHLRTVPGCELAEPLSCDLDDQGHLRTDQGQETSMKGVYAAGDITGGPYLAIQAASEGVRAAMSIHRSLLPQRLEL